MATDPKEINSNDQYITDEYTLEVINDALDHLFEDDELDNLFEESKD